MRPNSRRLETTVKETVDFVYSSTSANPEGVSFSADALGYTESRIMSVLVKRGILEKMRISGRRGVAFKYRWVATSSPTRVLYGSIVDEIRDYNHAHANKKATPKKEKPAEKLPDVRIVNELFEKKPILLIDEISDETLWVELKRRGWEGIITKTITQTLN